MDRQLKGHRALRKGRYSQSCHFYHVVVKAAGQHQPFECLYNSRLLVRVLMEQWRRRHAETLAYCLMPDHLHWLIGLENDTLPFLIKRVKSITTLKIGYSVWQRGYYDHLIRSDENLVNVARYIVQNPLEAGLVSSVRDYPHWDSVWL